LRLNFKEHPFPVGPNDAWDALQWTATNFLTSPHLIGAAPREKGFLVGGTSAGGNFAAVVAHLAKDAKLDPPLTGQYLSIPAVLPPSVVPEKHKSKYLSAEQNTEAPILSKSIRDVFLGAYHPDMSSELFVPFNHPSGHDGLPPAYFQICGLDPLRDEALIYEEVLRTECGVKTRLDIYPGLPHGFWAFFPMLSSSKKLKKDTIKGVAWLLGSEVDVDSEDLGQQTMQV
jgi:acetyl esterase/lipase